jgi:hypothetical protein
MKFTFRVCYVARLQRAVSGGGFPGVAPQAQPQAGMWYAFSVLFGRTQTSASLAFFFSRNIMSKALLSMSDRLQVLRKRSAIDNWPFSTAFGFQRRRRGLR